MSSLEITIPDALIDTIVQRLKETIGHGTPQTQWLTVREAAAHLGLSQHSLRALIKRNRIPFYRIEGRILLERGELDDWVRAGADSP
jgi:excisionase family DNA binding protein